MYTHPYLLVCHTNILSFDTQNICLLHIISNFWLSNHSRVAAQTHPINPQAFPMRLSFFPLISIVIPSFINRILPWAVRLIIIISKEDHLSRQSWQVWNSTNIFLFQVCLVEVCALWIVSSILHKPCYRSRYPLDSIFLYCTISWVLPSSWSWWSSWVNPVSCLCQSSHPMFHHAHSRWPQQCRLCQTWLSDQI